MALNVGTTDTIAHGDVAALDSDAAWTWMAYFRRVGAGNFTNDLFDLLKKGANCYLYCSSNASPNGIAQYDGSGGEGRSSTANLLTTSFQHVCVTNVGGGTQPSIIVNRVSQALAGGAQTFTDTGAAVLQWTGNSGSAFEVAHFKFWSRAFSLDEIIAESYSYEPLNIPNLLIWSPYDDALQARDYSGNANHGTPSGGVTQVVGPTGVAYDSRAMLARARRGSYGRRNAFRRLGGIVPLHMAGV